jgi:hypothetical protein
MTPIHDIVRVVAVMSPRGQWVTVKAVAGALHAQFAEVAAAVAVAVQRRELESEQDDWGISWTRMPARSSSTQSTSRAAIADLGHGLKQ